MVVALLVVAMTNAKPHQGGVFKFSKVSTGLKGRRGFRDHEAREGGRTPENSGRSIEKKTRQEYGSGAMT